MISPAYLSVFTRVLIQCPETFDAVLEEVAKVMDTSPVNTVIGFMEFWLDQVQHETAQPLLMYVTTDGSHRSNAVEQAERTRTGRHSHQFLLS